MMSRMMNRPMMRFGCGRTVLKIVIMNLNSMLDHDILEFRIKDIKVHGGSPLCQRTLLGAKVLLPRVCLLEVFRPLEQLMGVFPAASSKHVPEPWASADV
ncbi:hypothetical protein NQ317_001765 [Molorchus minor]|uniref:Xrn1 helical domain-containing protein n=1 Tax=Molorchus minor TaxID=1323400 RepID=A0ABQ9JJ95_9CUCU|nr:hypothetical protein NQ317_001765 [Molorchus minor]